MDGSISFSLSQSQEIKETYLSRSRTQVT